MEIAGPPLEAAPARGWAERSLLPTRPALDLDEDERFAAKWYARQDDRMAELCRSVIHLVSRHHRVTLEGTEHLPAGPALLVGNHGHLGYETLFFFAEVLRHTGCMPRGLADRWLFKVPLVRDLLVRLGGVCWHPTSERRLLAEGQWVVCYPGGMREALKRSNAERYLLQWDKNIDFVRLALEMGVPIVPFAGAGVDDTFDVAGSYPGTGRFFMGHDKYDFPRLSGSNLRLMPRPVPFLFRFGRPLRPPRSPSAMHAAGVNELHMRVCRSAQRLLDETVRIWLRRHCASLETA